jgi:hypothetical protein
LFAIDRGLRFHDTAAMATLERHSCTACGTTHEVHRHQVSVANRGSLPCPQCDAPFLKWDGAEFLTLAVAPPSSSHEMPTIVDPPPEPAIDF